MSLLDIQGQYTMHVYLENLLSRKNWRHTVKVSTSPSSHLIRRVEFIHALCVLHNVGNKEDLTAFEPPETDEHINDDQMTEEVVLEAVDINAENLRNALCNDAARRTPRHVMRERANAAALRHM